MRRLPRSLFAAASVVAALAAIAIAAPLPALA